MTPTEPNHARERLSGASAQPFELGYQPDADDFRRWLLTDAERIVAAEELRVNNPRPGERSERGWRTPPK